MSDEEDQKDLLELYKIRLHDRSRYGSKRKRMAETRPRSFASLLENYFKGDSFALKRIEENRAIQAWPGIVGEAAARISQPLRIRGGKLIVKIQDPLWQQQLMLLKHELLKKYHAAFPKLQLRDIFYVRN